MFTHGTPPASQRRLLRPPGCSHGVCSHTYKPDSFHRVAGERPGLQVLAKRRGLIQLYCSACQWQNLSYSRLLCKSRRVDYVVWSARCLLYGSLCSPPPARRCGTPDAQRQRHQCAAHVTPTFTCAFNQTRTSPTRQSVTRSESFTGLGKAPDLHLRQSVAELIGTTSGMSWACRKKPVSGNASKDVAVLVDT